MTFFKRKNSRWTLHELINSKYSIQKYKFEFYSISHVDMHRVKTS